MESVLLVDEWCTEAHPPAIFQYSLATHESSGEEKMKVEIHYYFFLSGCEIKLACDIARYVVAAQLALELFGRCGGLGTESGIITIWLDIPVDLVEWSRSGGGLCAGFRELGGMCWVREGEKVWMAKSLSNSK